MKCKRVISLDLPSVVLSELDTVCSHFDVSRSLVLMQLIHFCFERLLSDPIFTSDLKLLSDSEYYAAVRRIFGGSAR